MRPPASGRVREQRALRRFAFDNAVVGAAQAVSKLRGLLTLPLIVKTMGTEGYGSWAQITAFVAITGAALGFSLHLPMVRRLAEARGDANGGDTRRTADVYASALGTTLAFTLPGVLLLASLAGPLSQVLLADATRSDLIWGALGWVVCRNVCLINGNVYRAVGRFGLRSAVDFSGACVEVGGILWILGAGGSLGDLLTFLVSWNALLAAATTAHALSITGVGRPRAAIVRFCLEYSAPLLPSALAVWALDRADRLIVGHYHGLTGVGVYAAAYAIGSAVLNFQTPLQMTLIPKIAQLWGKDRPLAQRYLALSARAFLTLAIPYAMGVSVLGAELLGWLGNEEMAAANPLLIPLIALGVLFWGLSIIQHQVFHGAKTTGPIGRIGVATTLVNLALNFALVPAMGAVGAALATVLAYATGFVALRRKAQAILPIPLSTGYVVRCVAAAALMGGVLWLWSPAAGAPLIGSLLLAPWVYLAALVSLGGLSRRDRDTLRELWKTRASA